MKAWQVFASMDPERAVRFFASLQQRLPGFYNSAVGAASASLRARPVFLLRQPVEKRAEAMRQALAKVRSNDLAEEILASYFLDCRKELVVEWLDALGLAHEEGILKEDEPACPAPEVLREATQKFLAAGDDADRPLLLRAFAAQRAIDWPELEVLIAS
jgi:hypothetical protein